MNQAKPFVKWVGGKSRLIDQLLPLVPDKIDAYCEPFLGGGAMFFALNPPGERTVLSDMNPLLMRTYQRLGRPEGPGIIWRNLEDLAKRHSEDAYLSARNWLNKYGWDTYVCWHTMASVLIYLNKTCFNGLWRVNRAGHFNVPVGVKGPIQASRLGSKANLEAVCYRLLDVRLVAATDYAETTDLAYDNSFVYLDPPYVGTFSSYTPGGWGGEDHARLLDHAKWLAHIGHDVMVSNSLAAEEMYRAAGFHIHYVGVPNTVGGKGARRGGGQEIVATSYTNYRGVRNANP